jgi:glycosyltransferase involved in cell wall biosynthesis
MRRERFDIVHTHLPGPDMVGGLVSWWTSLGHKRIVSVHNQRHRVGVDYPHWALRWSWGTADGLVAISDAVREYVERRIGIAHGQATVIPYGLPIAPRLGDAFIRQELGLTDEPLLLNVGRVVPQKGQLHLIDAMPEVLRRSPRSHLAIVGHTEGDYAATLARHVHERGLERRVHLLGYREMGVDAMAEADVFVFPSLWEGFGLAVIEAMQAGVPVVCSDRGPLREIVLDGETGLLIPPRDPLQLAAGILRILEAPEFAARLSAQAQRRARETFGVETMIERTHRFYLEALGVEEAVA